MDAHCQTLPHPRSQSRIETDATGLRQSLGLSSQALPASEAGQAGFRFKVPEAFADRMRSGDIDDPLLRQVWPSPDEEMTPPGYHQDPVGDEAATISPGLLQKYRGRALLVITGACAIHCRYCFRRHFPYSQHREDEPSWGAALAQIRRDATLREIILSGGDPLTLSTRRLASLLDNLVAVPHVKRLRIHTRIPVVLPARLDGELLDLLAKYAPRLIMVIHANHSREIDDTVRETLIGLRARGITLLNQSVLLRGINDTAPALTDLSDKLFDCGVLPYYLHQLDPVAGAAHFQVDDDTARALHDALLRELPGYLVPRLVRETPGAPSKLPL